VKYIVLNLAAACVQLFHLHALSNDKPSFPGEKIPSEVEMVNQNAKQQTKVLPLEASREKWLGCL